MRWVIILNQMRQQILTVYGFGCPVQQSQIVVDCITPNSILAS